MTVFMTTQKSSPPLSGLRPADRKWAPFAAAFLLFAVFDLVGLLLVPAPAVRTGDVWFLVLLPPVLSGVLVLFTLPSLLRLFERQEERIERQQKQIASLHAMDTAIASEQQMDRLLSVAAREATLALDADRGGVLLLPGEDGESGAEAFHNVPGGDDAAQRDQFRELLRRGAHAAEQNAVARMPIERVGQLLGYLAVTRAREASHPGFGPDDFALLRELAGTVVVAVKNARALERARQSAAAQEVARVLQAGLLPPVPRAAGPWRLSKRYEAQSDEAEVGGDIYDFFALGNDRWGVMIADVSGKGLAAARKTAMVKYALRAFAREHASPARVLSRLNDALCDEEEMRSGFVTLVYGVLDAHGGFVYASAGHEKPLVCRTGAKTAERIEMLAATGLVLGAAPCQTYGESEITLRPGDGLLLYTDGLSEARPEGTHDFLEVEGLARILHDCCAVAAVPASDDDDPNAVVNAVFERVTAYANGRQADDVALLWIQRTAAS